MQKVEWCYFQISQANNPNSEGIFSHVPDATVSLSLEDLGDHPASKPTRSM
jgi:hypothetical protein